MPVLTLNFSEQFGVFSRRLRAGNRIAYPFKSRRSIKHIIESVGVPHTEVGRIDIGNRPVDFQFVPVQSGTVTISTIDPPYDATTPSFLRPDPLDAPRYIADVNVGKLAGSMRMIGLDTEYSCVYGDDEIAVKAKKENRIVLTKDIGLLKRRQIVYGRYIRAVHPDDQLKEVVDFFGLSGCLRPFTRCIRCNSELVFVDKKKIAHRLLPKTRRYFHRFKRCEGCRRVYWRGSHHMNMEKRVRNAGIPVKRSG